MPDNMSNLTNAPTAVVPFTAEQDHIVWLVNVIASTLSLLGSLFIVACYVIFPTLRKFSFKLVRFPNTRVRAHCGALQPLLKSTTRDTCAGWTPLPNAGPYGFSLGHYQLDHQFGH